jgi:hypothetical protein
MTCEMEIVKWKLIQESHNLPKNETCSPKALSEPSHKPKRSNAGSELLIKIEVEDSVLLSPSNEQCLKTQPLL